MPKEIKLVLHGNNIEPEDANESATRAATSGKRSQLRQGEQAQFSIGDELTDASITFQLKSPFGPSLTANYKDTLTVEPTAAPGVYQYDCSAKDGKGVTRHSAGGGEVEIIGL